MKGKTALSYLGIITVLVALAFFISVSFAGAGIALTKVAPSPVNASNISTIGTQGYFYVNFTSNESLVSIPILSVYNISGDGANGLYPMTVNGTDATANYASFNVSGLSNGTFEWKVTGINTSSLGVNQTFGNFTVTFWQIYANAITNPINTTNTTSYTPTVKVSVNNTYLANLSLTFYTKKGDILQARLNTTILNSTESSFVLPALDNGTYDIIAEVGNRGNPADLKINSSSLRLIVGKIYDAVITSPANNTNTTSAKPSIKVSVNSTFLTNITLAFYVRQGTIVQARLNTSILNGTETTFSLLGLYNGTYNITAEYGNGADYPAANMTPIALNIDTDPPIVSITSPVNNTNVTDTDPEIRVTVTDSSDTNLSLVVTVYKFSMVVNATMNITDTRILYNTTILNNTDTGLNLTLGVGYWKYKVEVTDDVFVVNAVNSTLNSINISTLSVIISNPANNLNTADTTPEIKVVANSSQYYNMTLTLYTDSGTTRVARVNTTILNGTETNYTLTTMSDGRYNITAEIGNGADLFSNVTITNIAVDATGPTWDLTTIRNLTTTTTAHMTGVINVSFSDSVTFVDGCSIKIFGTQTGNTSRMYNSTSASYNQSANRNRTCSFVLSEDMIGGEGQFIVGIIANDSAGSASAELNYTNWTKVTLVANKWNLITSFDNTTLGQIGNYSHQITSVSIFNNTAGTYESWTKGTATLQASPVGDGQAVYVYVNATATLVRHNFINGNPRREFNLSNTTAGGWNQVGVYNRTGTAGIMLFQVCKEKTGIKYVTFIAANESKYYSHRCGFSFNNDTVVPRGYAVWMNAMNVTENFLITKPIAG